MASALAGKGEEMSDEYIKKEDAVKAVANTYWQGTDCECYAFAHKALDNVPTADVAPVRHGRWKEQQKKYRIYSCSECNKVTLFEKWGDTVMPYDYCPNCGARMDAKE